MFSLYSIIIALFIISGLIMTLWGWSAQKQSRRRLDWPKVAGEIIRCDLQADDDPMLPCIEYRYQIEDRQYRARFHFPSATSPSEELSKSYVARYPLGAAVEVFYQADNPQHSTLEPQSQGDWLLLAIGIVTTVLGLVFLFSPLL